MKNYSPWPTPPTFGDSYRKMIFDLHIRFESRSMAIVGSTSGAPTRLWSASYDTDGVLQNKHVLRTPNTPFEEAEIEAGAHFKEIYGKYGGLRDDLAWDDHLGNAWATGLLDEIRLMWGEVSTKLD